MFGKPPVTALQEYCAKKGIELPKYAFIPSSDSSFVFSVEALNLTSYGYGRSKKEAKHDAAANLIKAAEPNHPDLKLIPQAPHETIPTSDLIVALRDLCVLKNHPLPTFQIVQQAGPAEAPEFTVLCQVASIKRYGVANTKKAAKQKAALDLLNIIQLISTDGSDSVAVCEPTPQEAEELRYLKLKTYRQLTESENQDSGIPLSERHMFFEKFYPDLKNKAHHILNTRGTYASDRACVDDLFKVLNINPKTEPMPTEPGNEQLFLMDLQLEYDVTFIGDETNIYSEIISYFKDMI